MQINFVICISISDNIFDQRFVYTLRWLFLNDRVSFRAHWGSFAQRNSCICLIGIFSERKTLKLLTDSLSFELIFKNLSGRNLLNCNRISVYGAICALLWLFHVHVFYCRNPFFLLHNCCILSPYVDYRTFIFWSLFSVHALSGTGPLFLYDCHTTRSSP